MKIYKIKMSDGVSIKHISANSESHAMSIAERKMQDSAFGSRAISATQTKGETQ
jgi:hypothetical protein